MQVSFYTLDTQMEKNVHFGQKKKLEKQNEKGEKSATWIIHMVFDCYIKMTLFEVCVLYQQHCFSRPFFYISSIESISEMKC